MACLHIPSHDCRKKFLCAADVPWRRAWYLNSLFIEASIGVPPASVVLFQVVNVFGLSTVRRSAWASSLALDGRPGVYLQWIFLGGKLLCEIPSITPEREVGPC